MKKILFSLVALLISVSAVALTPTHVRVNPASGDPILFSFESQPEIAFLADGIKVTSSGAEPLTLTFDALTDIDFVSPEGVQSLADDVIKVNTYADRIEFSNIPQGVSLTLYSLSGQILYNATPAGEASIYKTDYPRGVYIVVIGSTSFKLSF
ncbi:MAG: T9SS type A sorting domain-containing protein [Muribaculaceae bacterium]|nr:T9SS type A sorting domain-containing protein [Muribaculaceae bacterium]